MKCTEAYTIIQNCLQYSSSDQVREARSIMQQFKEDFEKTDEALSDKTLKDICLRLAETHFKCPDAVRKEPRITIREEYLKRTGRHLDEFYCEKAYRNAAEEKASAGILLPSAPDRLEEDDEEDKKGCKNAEKQAYPANRISEIIDAEKCRIQI